MGDKEVNNSVNCERRVQENVEVREERVEEDRVCCAFRYLG